MNPCDCCEGTEPITPLSLANRPGLNALSYRMGTHGAFFETMKAALSSHILADGKRPLTNLTARESSDPAIAWLDSWATVADVLTFYQERIANEGYLRTATERRSVLELARLVGYRLRPGVAATVFLAYMVDKGYTITIPAGSRAQTIPGADELPQSFETAVPLPARDVWNNLKPRLTKPQAIRGDEGDLYLAGINTNLKANDPLLFVFDDSPNPPLALHHVESVTVQAVEDRTQVTLQTTPEAKRVEALIVKASQALAEFGEGPKSEMADRVNLTLAQFQKELTGVHTLTGLADVFDKTVLSVQEEHKVAVDSQFTRLAPWVGGVAETLTKLAGTAARASRLSARATPMATRRKGRGEGKETAVSHLSPYLTALAKPPSRPPANSLKLGRNISQTYADTSDMSAKLLRTLQPDLADVLYQSWRNLPLTDATTLSLYGFRTRASVFGHNAPASDTFGIRVSLVGKQEGFGIRITIIIGDRMVIFPPEEDPPLPMEDSEFDIDFPAANETIAVTLSTGDQLPLEMSFRFTHLPILVDGRIDAQGRFQVNSSGSNPVTLKFDSGSNNSPGVIAAARNDLPEIVIQGKTNKWINSATEKANVLWLDTAVEKIVPGSWVVLERPFAYNADRDGKENDIPKTVIARVTEVSEQSRSDYGLPGIKSTRLTLDQSWFDPEQESFEVIRATAVYAQSELLPLAEAPIDPIEGALCGTEIELAGLYDGLEAGRWLIITGERTDVQPDEDTERLSGLTATELVMLAGVEQVFDPALPGEVAHTKLSLAEPLAYCYKLDTVTIYGNVVKASHGETRQEVLGSGNGRVAFQAFILKQPPLTYLSDPNPSGVQSSLTVRVNDIQWHEADNLTEMEPNDHEFTTQTDNEDKTTVIFGNGHYGARLPTGTENVKAVYRNGIGKAGNAAAEQISLLATRPLGVKGVINPLRASGGANRDNLEQARRNVPLAVMALDRLVSTQDYADFASTFAGIGKASAVALTDGRREVVHLTIAGVDDIPIDESSDLYRNLRQALHQFGDPYQPIQIDMRQRKLLIISAKVRLLADYLWESVAPQIRAAVVAAFSFDRRDLGQDVVLSELMSIMQKVAGVAYVDVDVLDAVAETADIDTLTRLANTLSLKKRIEAKMAWVDAQATDPDAHIQPAQLVYLSPDVPDTLILTELT